MQYMWTTVFTSRVAKCSLEEAQKEYCGRRRHSGLYWYVPVPNIILQNLMIRKANYVIV